MSSDDDAPTAWIRPERTSALRPAPVGRGTDRHTDRDTDWDTDWPDDDEEDTARIAAGPPPVPGAAGVPRDRGPAAASAGHGFGRVLLLTVVGAVLPGTALLAAGRRRLGSVVLVFFVVLLAGAAWLATDGQRTAVRLAVDPGALLVLMIGLVAVAVAWVLLVVAGYRMLAPDRTTSAQHVLGGLLVALLGLGIALPAFEAVRLAAVQRDLIGGLFAGGESATVRDPGNAANPFGDQERVNVLLLGGDGGEDRDGVRTDTVIVASIDTGTGLTTLFSLPRNLEELPFPADSPLAEVYPDGFDAGSEGESLLNAVYRNGPAQNPDILGPTDNPGADFLKLGVGEALGLRLDFYVLVNLEGFSRLVDALGGVTVNVNYYVPIGGEPTIGTLPDDYIAPGPNQLLDGEQALNYARGRFGLTDYDRMDRQRCTLDAIVAAANPATLLRQYQELAATTQDIVQTDIPQSVLDDFVDLAFLVQEAGVRSVVFDDTVISPAYPDYDEIRVLVQQALGAEPVPDDSPSPPAPVPGPSSAAVPPPAPSSSSVDDVRDACAYDRVAAQEALDAGEPPTRRRR